MTELKNLTASGSASLGPSIKSAFDVLNLNRMQTGIDTYGHGRSPFYFEPSIVILITDGGRMPNSAGGYDELNFSPSSCIVPGAELTKEFYRWDQRLFALVLRLTGTLPSETVINGAINSVVACDKSPINGLCEETGGMYCIRSINAQTLKNWHQIGLSICTDSVSRVLRTELWHWLIVWLEQVQQSVVTRRDCLVGRLSRSVNVCPL